MKLFKFAVATAFATFLLLIVGGTVNPTGSSLACPDWPLCFGEVFPEMKGGVRFEHTHRMVATLVGLMTVALAVWIRFARRDDHRLGTMGIVAVILVAVQGALGGITVLLKLPMLVSAAHLALSMFFFCFLIYLCFRIRHGPVEKTAAEAKPRARRWAAAAMHSVYLQIILGAVVRHTGSGRACGTDWLFCQGGFWPYWAEGRLHMLHRFIGLAVLAVVVLASVSASRWTKDKGKKGLIALSLAMPALVVLQIVLGAVSVATAIGVVPITAHLGVGAALLGACAVLYFAMGPLAETKT